MRPILLAASLSILAVPAFAQKPEGPTIDLPRLLELLRPDPGQVRRAVEAAAAHPLGSGQNPVRAAGPPGAHDYIARLRCADGNGPRVGQRGSGGFGPFGSFLDSYPLDCGQAEPGRITLAMDRYHPQHREDRAPPGFTIEPR